MVDPGLTKIRKAETQLLTEGAVSRKAADSHGRTQKRPRARGHWVLLNGVTETVLNIGIDKPASTQPDP